MNSLYAEDYPAGFQDLLKTVFYVCIWIAVLSFAHLLTQPATISYYDESIVLTGALQWLKGNMPAIDYYTVYGPLQFYIVSVILKFSDVNFFLTRVLYAVTMATPVILLTRLFAFPTPFERSLRVVFISSMLFFCAWFGAASYPSHTLPLLLTALLFLKLDRTPAKSWAVRTLCLSIVLTLVTLLRPSIGAVLVVGLFLAIPFDAFNRRKFAPGWLAREAASLVSATAIALIALLLANKLTNGALEGILDIIFNIQSQMYAPMRALPFPGFHAEPMTVMVIGTSIGVYFPLISMLCGGLLYSSHILRLTVLPDTSSRTLFWLLFFSALLFTLGIVRTDLAHLLPTMILSSALACYLVMILVTNFQGLHFKRGLFYLNLIFAPFFLMASLWVFGVNSPDKRPSIVQNCTLQNASDAFRSCLSPHKSMRETLPELKRILEPDEKFFSANDRHDRIFVNNMSYYSSSGHMPISYWAHMDPGVQTTAPVQQEIVDELKNHAQEYGRSIVVIAETHHKTEPNQSAYSSGITLLDDYLKKCTQIVRHGESRILSCNPDQDNEMRQKIPG